MRATLWDRQERKSARMFVVLFAVALIWAAMAVGVDAGYKPYSVVLSPLTSGSGPGQTFTATVTNWSTQQSLGSINITPPSGFTFPLESPVVSPPTGWSVVSNVLQGRNLGLTTTSTSTPASVTVTFKVTVPPACGSFTWATLAKQSNDFSGLPGNGFNLSTDPSQASQLTTKVTGGCKLAFTVQPKSAVHDQTITNAAYNPAGTSVTVQVQDTGGNAVSLVAAVTLTLVAPSGDPPAAPSNGATLGGTTSGTTNASGSLSFSDIFVSMLGFYRLHATSPSVQPGTSSAFTIVDSAIPCSTSCSADASVQGGQQFNVSSAGQSGAYLATSVDLLQIDCSAALYGGYAQPDGPAGTTSTIAFDYTGGNTKTLTIKIPKAVVNQVPDNGASHFQVCFSSDRPFPVRSGGDPPGTSAPDPVVTAATGYDFFTGTLKDCPRKNQAAAAPCVVSRTKDNAGQVILTALVAAGDPYGR